MVEARNYVVQSGDTLSSIAKHFYDDGSEHAWRQIYTANRAVIGADPNVIKPGEKLTIPTYIPADRSR